MQHTEYGPLAFLIGSWQGVKGVDNSPNAARAMGTHKFREEMHFEPMGLVDNHEQKLFSLRYRTTAWKLEAADPFHEELGYWLWDAANLQVMRCFLVPRGVSVIAGATVEAEANNFHLSAELGSPTYGICSNQFLDQEFKTVRYELDVNQIDANSFFYKEDTQIQMRGKTELFHHTDENTLSRI